MGKHPARPAQLPDDEYIAGVVARAEQIIGYEFEDKALLARALTHPSAVEERRIEMSYERLEFLGDALLGGIVALLVYERFPEINEGGMTRLKSLTVSGNSLSSIMEELGFSELIIFGRSEQGTDGRGLHSALENVYESIVAALVLDGGFGIARYWVRRTLGQRIEDARVLHPTNPKSELQEILQNDGHSPEYRLVSEDGPPHDRIFTIEALCDGEPIGRGTGRTKKEAEAAAAQDAIASRKQE